MKINEKIEVANAFMLRGRLPKVMTISPQGNSHTTIQQLLRVMKLTMLIVTVCLLQVSALTKAQITIKANNQPLQKVLEAISKQSGYDFAYATADLKNLSAKHLDLKSATIEQALAATFSNQPLQYEIADRTVMIKRKPEPSIIKKVIYSLRAVDVSGKIVDENDQPLVGATVTIKGSNLGARTDSNGEFILKNIDENSILVISYLGYATKELKAEKNMGTIRLEISTDKLDAVSVVSTGYQTLPKERATGSFEKVDNELFNRTTGTDVISRLNGIVPGLLFNNKAAGPKTLNTATIRGLSSLSVVNPLIVLDNLAYEGDVNNINPNDVESITLLKDAASASIWGTRAGNGVIVITTKKGVYDRPLSISLNANLTTSERPDLEYLSQINSSEFIDVEKFLFDRGFYNSKIARTSPFRPFLTPVVELLAKQRSLPVSDISGRAAIDAQIDAFRQYDVRNEYQKYIYRDQFNQQYALNLSGGGKASSYFISGGLDRNLNNIVNSSYNRINLHSIYNFRPIKALEIQTGFYYTQNRSTSLGGNSSVGYRTGTMANVYPYARFTDDQGNPAVTGLTYGVDYLNNLANNPNLLDWRYRILDDLDRSKNWRKNEDLQFSVGSIYSIAPFISVDVKYQYTSTNSYNEEIYSQDSYYVRDLVNTYTNPTNFARAIPLGGIYIPSHGRTTSQTLRGQLSVDKTWNNVHQLAAIAGAEIRGNHNEGNSEGARYAYDPDTKTFKTVDYLNGSLPLFFGGGAQIPYGAGYGDGNNRNTSLFTNLSYTYNNRYVVSASIRKDASNVFGTRSNKKGAPLWHGGLSWNVSNEPFYKFELVPYLKLRATYGYSGNTIPSVPAFSLATKGVDYYTQLPNTISQNLPNPDLRWEKVGMLNFGIDFGTKNNRLSGSIEYFRKKSTDVIASSPVDVTTGFNTQQFNTANLKGQGIDLTLHSINLKNSLFGWSTDFILSYSRNKVSKYLLENSNSLSYINSTGINPIEGKDVYAIFALRWAGLDPLTGDPQGYLNGQVSKTYNSLLSVPISDLRYYGSSVPLYYGALRNSFSIGRFTLSANILYKFKYYFKRQGLSYGNLFNANTGLAEFTNRWQKKGDEAITNVPSMVYPANSARDSFYNNSEAVIAKGDHIRLQDITAAYTFKNALGLKNFKLYANVTNLGLIWKANKVSLDPDINSGYRSPRTLAFGVNTYF